MNFKYKCFLQSIISSFPNSERIEFFFQRHVSRSLPRPDHKFLQRLRYAKEHFDLLQKYSRKNAKDIVYYEFGAGWDLIMQLGFSLLGIGSLYCIDIRENVFPALVNDSIGRLRRLKKEIPFPCTVPDDIPKITAANIREVLEGYFNIRYLAPLDARDTMFPGGTVDFIVSQDTMEHIPEEDVPMVFRECYRIMNKGGIGIFVIDYKDHWSYFDKSLSPYNFLRYSPAQWAKYNPALHYQNRLRHTDYMKIIRKAGFEVVEEHRDLPSEEDQRLLAALPVYELFRSRYSADELAVKGVKLVLRK